MKQKALEHFLQYFIAAGSNKSSQNLPTTIYFDNIRQVMDTVNKLSCVSASRLSAFLSGRSWRLSVVDTNLSSFTFRLKSSNSSTAFGGRSSNNFASRWVRWSYLRYQSTNQPINQSINQSHLRPVKTLYAVVAIRRGVATGAPNQSTLIFLCGCFVSLTHLYPPKSNSWLRLWLYVSVIYTVVIFHPVQHISDMNKKLSYRPDSAIIGCYGITRYLHDISLENPCNIPANIISPKAIWRGYIFGDDTRNQWSLISIK